MGKTLRTKTVEQEGKAPQKTQAKVGSTGKKPSKVRYKTEMRWASNKIRKLKRHVKAHARDAQSRTALDWLTS